MGAPLGVLVGAAVHVETPVLILVIMDVRAPAQRSVAVAGKHVPRHAHGTAEGRHGVTVHNEEIYYDEVYVENAKTHKPWMGVLNDGYHDGMESDKYTLSWAPEINTHTPDVTDRKKGKSWIWRENMEFDQFPRRLAALLMASEN